MSDDYGIDYGHYNSGGSGPPEPPNGQGSKAFWTFGLIAGFAAAMLGERLLGGALFLMCGGVAIWHDYDENRRWQDRLDHYEREHGPHPSRRPDSMRVATWLKTPLGKQWLETPQAREFLATPHGRQFRKDSPSEGR